MKPLRMALAGVGGFGRVHVQAAVALAREGLVQAAAFAEPLDTPPGIATLEQLGARRYRDYYAMLESEADLDFVCIATPIPDHVPMAGAAFARGLHVFLEKPPAVRIQDLRELVRLQRESGCSCAVDFHDMARPEVRTLKHLLCDGAVGAVRAIRSEGRWQRTNTYFARSPWAGRLTVGDRYVLDGPMNNACAHTLNLASYLAGATFDSFARPQAVQGELYRANPIEGEDTDCLRARMDTGAEVTIHLTLCASENHPRTWTIIGDEGEARLHDTEGLSLHGESVSVEALPEPPHQHMLRSLVAAIHGHGQPRMTLERAEGYVLLANGAYESAGAIRTIPETFLEHRDVDGATAVHVPGIDDLMLQVSREGRLLSECDIPWAHPTPPWDLHNYGEFPQRWEA